MNENNVLKPEYQEAVKNIKAAILRSQYKAAKYVSDLQLSLNYGIGRYVSAYSRAGYWGTGAIETISQQLQKELPGLRGYSAENIRKMRKFYEEWSPYLNWSPMATEIQASENDIIETVLLNVNQSPKATNFNLAEFLSISFTHHMEILHKTESLEERMFYIHQAVVNRWDKYTLRYQLAEKTFYHQGQMPNNFAERLPDTQHALKAIEMFKDEYLLDFINVEELGERDKEDIDERVVENAIVHNIKNFIMTFGQDFTFVGNQYRVEALGHEHYIDLLFYNRELTSLVAVELKKGAFKPSYLGQLNMYLRVLDDLVRKPNENPSIGVILCKSAVKAYVEYAVRDYEKPMGVATYMTANDMPEKLRKALPDIEELKKLL